MLRVCTLTARNLSKQPRSAASLVSGARIEGLKHHDWPESGEDLANALFGPLIIQLYYIDLGKVLFADHVVQLAHADPFPSLQFDAVVYKRAEGVLALML